MVEYRKPTHVALDAHLEHSYTPLEDEGGDPPKPPRSWRTKLLIALVVVGIAAGLVAIWILWGVFPALLIVTVGSGALYLGIIIWGLINIGK